MATLAIAWATGEGLDIVSDQRSGLLHDCLISMKPNDIYETWINPPSGQIAGSYGV